MKFTNDELELIFEVLDSGMPESKIKRDKIAKIWNALAEYLKK